MPRKSTRLLLVSALLVSAGTSGCAGPPPHRVDWNAEGRAVTLPDAYQHLWVREVSVHDVAANTTADRTLPDERFQVSPAVAREVVQDAVVRLGLARTVSSLPGSAPGRPGTVDPEFRTPVTEPAPASASAPGEGLILDIALLDATLVHMGENDQATKAFWLWLLMGLPGHSVRDQLYEVACEPLFQISDGASGEVLVPWQPLARPDVGPYALNFHERTTGATPYLISNVCPPSAISIDPDEVVRQILPATLRPSLASLAERFREIGFAPTSKITLARTDVAGVKVEDAQAPSETRTDQVALVLVLGLEQGAGSLQEVRVGGKTRLDFAKGSAAPLVKDGKLELRLDVEVPPAGSTDVEVVLEGSPEPRKILTLTAEKGEARPEWRR